MATTVLQGDIFVTGTLTPTGLNAPAGSIGDAQVGGTPIQATKLVHQHRKEFAQDHGTTAVTARHVIHAVRGATGTVTELVAGVTVANIGAATVTVDLLKNGTSILSATISLTSSQAAFALVAAAGFTSTALVTGDVLEISVTATAGGGTLGLGLFAQLTHTEAAQ